MGTSTTLDAAASSAHAPKAKKPLWQGLGFQIVVAMILGAAVGLLFPSFASQLKILGDIFLRLIKSLIVPLVASTLIVGIGVGVAAVDQADVVARRLLGDGVQCGGRLGHERSVEYRSYV